MKTNLSQLIKKSNNWSLNKELEETISTLKHREISSRYGKVYIERVCRKSSYIAMLEEIENLKSWDRLAGEKMVQYRLSLLGAMIERKDCLLKGDEYLLKMVYPTKELLYEAYKEIMGEEKAFANKYRLYCMYSKF